MLAEIHNRYPSLTEAERRIADVILADPDAVTRLQARALAERAGTASSAVTRFCVSVGAGSFRELKLRLAEERAQLSSPETLVRLHGEDGAGEVFARVFRSGINTLRDTLSMLESARIEAIADCFDGARRVVFFGVGTSSVIAIDAGYRFAQLGLMTESCTDILFMNVTAANLTAGDVAVGISHSGMTRATVDALRRAKAAGAVTVAITSFAGSLLAHESDHAVVAFSDEQNYPVEAVSARVAHICIIDAFMMTLATRRRETLSAHLLDRNQILRDMRYPQ